MLMPLNQGRGKEVYKMNSTENISKPFNLGTGSAIKIENRFIEFPTEEEAYEYYREKKGKQNV